MLLFCFVKNLNFVSIHNNTNTHKDSANLRLFWPHTSDNNAFTGLVIPLIINDYKQNNPNGGKKNDTDCSNDTRKHFFVALV